MRNRRIILIILDACGVGDLPDAAVYGDCGAATLPHVAQAVKGLQMPHLQALGLGNIVLIEGVPAVPSPLASYGKMAEVSPGKDSTTGHWEIGGIQLSRPFPVFPNGFPESLVQEFERRANVHTIGNIPASGTDIIRDLGEVHLRSEAIILYTSADSVFQLAAHEQLFPLPRLYDICQIAREMLTDEYAVARVIARPFVGAPGSFVRTSGRKDFSLTPPSDTFLDVASREKLGVLSIGKIYDLYAGRGITTAIKTANNDEVMRAVIEAVTNDHDHWIIFANCVDFDMLWGHRNDEQGFAQGLEAFDLRLGQLLSALREDDILILSADHGCDPTIKTSTDHTREYVPLLVYGRNLRAGVSLGVRRTFADIAATVCSALGLPTIGSGSSFWNEISAT